MPSARKCPKCGLDIADRSVVQCPACGAPIFATPRVGIWVGAVIQIVICTLFLLLFGFPKIMILIFAAVILAGAAIAAWVKPRASARATTAPRPVSNPFLLKIIGFFIAVSALVCLAFVLFGFVIFMNAWTRWHEYQGQLYQRTEFQVKHVYYQRGSKGGTDISASGMVEGHLESMSLSSYVHPLPRSKAELESRVPTGTVIPVYLFPNLKGRARVQVYEPVPPAEAAHRMTVSTVKTTLLALAVMAIVLFVLNRLRELCFVNHENTFQQVGSS